MQPSVMPLRTAALLVLTGFALATALILAAEAPARPAPAPLPQYFDPLR